MEHDVRGGGGIGAGGASHRPRHASRADAALRRHRRAAADAVRHRRVRPGHRRRLRAGLGASGRRRSGHRQVDHPDPGRGVARPGRHAASSISPARRRSGRSGSAPSALGSATRRSGSPRRRGSRTSSPRWTRSAGRSRRDRFHPDAVDRPRRKRAGHGHAGAHLGAGADPLRQGERRGDRARRPRHQGRPDRRAARGRAHGRRGALFRGRHAAITSACSARSRTASARPPRSASSR